MHAAGSLLFIQIPLLGLDSFVAGLMTGPVLKQRRKRLGLAVLFGLCDCAGSFMGATLPHAVPDFPVFIVYSLVVAAVLLAARRSASWLLSVPFILALDNLAAGAPAAATSVLAVSSGLMAWAGMVLSGFAWTVGMHRFSPLESLLGARSRADSGQPAVCLT
jgi:putative Mn2+ efflux pump MntP